MARRGQSGAGPRPRARAETAAVSLPRTRPGARLELARIVPSGRSIALGVALLVLAATTYAGGRFTSLFAVERVAVAGAPAPLRDDVGRVLGTVEGQSLLALDLDDLRARVEALPVVAGVSFDRAFPHTLAVSVVPERPVAVLRRGASSWLASARGRVMQTLVRGTRPALPRVWLGRNIEIRIGELLRGQAGAAVRAVAPLAGSSLPIAVASVHSAPGELTLKLRTGVELRLGDNTDLELKLAVAASVLARIEEETAYVDVSIPRWPVTGPTLNSEVQVESQPSSTG